MTEADDDTAQRMAVVLEGLVSDWLSRGYKYVCIKPDGSCEPVSPEVDFDVVRERAKAQRYELLSLTALSTKERVAKWLLDDWLQSAREEGQRELALLASPLPGRGGSA